MRIQEGPQQDRFSQSKADQYVPKDAPTPIYGPPPPPPHPLGPGQIDVDVTIPTELIKDPGESYSHPDDPSVPKLDIFEEIFGFPWFGLRDQANRNYFKHAEDILPANVKLSLFYNYGIKRFNVLDLSIYNHADYDITISNVFTYTKPLRNIYSPARVNSDDIRGAVLSPDSSLTAHLNPTTLFSNGEVTMEPSGLYNWETAYVTIYLAATTGYIKKVEFVIPGREVGGAPYVGNR